MRGSRNGRIRRLKKSSERLMLVVRGYRGDIRIIRRLVTGAESPT